jgi:hypothetical protein
MRALAPVIALWAAACGGGTDSLGLRAWLRVPGAQYVPGPLPAPSGGPEVLQASISRADVAPGLQDRSVHASLDPATSGVAVGIDGDIGYWVLPAAPPDVQEPAALTLDAPLVFSPFLPSGQLDLIVRAVSADGRAGTGATIGLRSQETQLAASALAITLSWDTEADLDLHVIDPSGGEIYWGRIASQGGALDFDSNQSCIIDGRRRERVLFAGGAPSGHYLVRVDTPSLCGEPTARWRVEAQLGEAVVARVRGQSIPSDTRGAHARGAGVLALELDVP